MDVGAKLEAARKACGYTREYVAKIINTSQQNIFKYEKGIVNNIPVKRIEALCALYGISVIDVLGWERSPEEKAPAPERDEREREIMEIFEKLPDKEKEKFVQLARLFAKE